MAVMMMTPGIERPYADKVQQAYTRLVERPVKQQLETIRQDPYDGAIANEEGLVRELIPDVDLFKRLGIPNTNVGAAMLGSLAKSRYAQITIHTGALADKEDCSFTFLLNRRLLDQKGVIIGDFVSCRLRGWAIADRKPVWVCEELQGAFG